MPKRPNYKQSKEILKLIKKSKRILVNCHRSPDLDSVGCALAMREVLRQMGKQVTIISPSTFREEFLFLHGAKDIKVVEYGSFPFSKYDLFIALDTHNIAQLTGSWEGALPSIPMIVIDHHPNNQLRADVRISDVKSPACALILYQMFNDWKISISKNAATDLLAGIMGDTVCFSVPSFGKEVFQAAHQLMELGADKKGIIENIYRQYDLGRVKFAGFILESIQRDSTLPLAWSVVNSKQFVEYGKPDNPKEITADFFFYAIKDVELGIIFLEEKPGFVKMSFRSRGKFDCSKLASRYRGGGHPVSSGAFMNGDLDSVVRDVLMEARKMLRTR